MTKALFTSHFKTKSRKWTYLYNSQYTLLAKQHKLIGVHNTLLKMEKKEQAVKHLLHCLTEYSLWEDAPMDNNYKYSIKMDREISPRDKILSIANNFNLFFNSCFGNINTAQRLYCCLEELPLQKNNPDLVLNFYADLGLAPKRVWHHFLPSLMVTNLTSIITMWST